MTMSMWIIAVGLVVACLCAVETAPAETLAPVTKTAATAIKKKTTVRTKKTVAKKAVKKTAGKSGTHVARKATTGELQTDVKFDDSVLHGNYQTPDEALARVENEKGLSDLLGVRKHFKDRLSAESEQE